MKLRVEFDDKELSSKMKMLGAMSSDKAVMGRVVKYAMANMVKTAKAYAPSKTGALRGAIKSKTRYYKNTGITVGLMLVDERIFRKPGAAGRYAYIVEYGSKAHKIPVIRTSSGRYAKSATGHVEHPGFRAVRYFQRAVDSESNSTVDRAIEKMRDMVAKEWGT